VRSKCAICCPALAFLFVCLALVSITSRSAADDPVRYLRFDEVQSTLSQFGGSGLPGSEIADEAAWNSWIRDRDSEIRSRIARGTEDSISNLILHGTSFTKLSRIEGPEAALSSSGELTPAARERVHALAKALASGSNAERVQFAREFLNPQGIATAGIEKHLQENLLRFIAEQRDYQQKLQQAQRDTDPNAVFLTRGTLFASRGLSVDTSLLPNFALEETLRSMLAKQAIGPGSVRRIAIIGPGLDFTDKRDGYDFYPLQTLQPFAVLEAVARLGLGKADQVSVVTLDLNPAVNAHVNAVAEKARRAQPYVIQLPRDAQADWNPSSVAYWQHFGELLGDSRKPLPVPVALRDVTIRSVAIHPKYVARLQTFDLNIVTQTLDLSPAERFDLIVATNILVYYDRLQQALAMAGIAHMMNPGGIFLANNVLPAQHDPALEYLGRKSIAYANSGAYGDDVVVYRRR
jgi:hypothetical protein